MSTPPPGPDDPSGPTNSEGADDVEHQSESHASDAVASDVFDAHNTVASDVLDAPDAIVYDLDGTLVDLAVDWDAVADDVIGTYAANALVAPTADLWTLLDSAADYGVHDAVEEAIAGHERSGARASNRLPLGDWLATGGADRPVAICSLNCEDACRVAVETHDLADHVDAVVGRDTAATHKPEPESLLAAIDALGVEPTRTLFVGDSASDRLTADRAGVPFATVSEALGR